MVPSYESIPDQTGAPTRDYRRIPKSWNEAASEDKLLITMRDAGESWPVIKRARKEISGTEVGVSTLPNRYSRIIAHRTHTAEGNVHQAKDQSPKRHYRRLPASWEEASREDRMLITMREADGSWSIIRRAHEDITRTEVGEQSRKPIQSHYRTMQASQKSQNMRILQEFRWAD